MRKISIQIKVDLPEQKRPVCRNSPFLIVFTCWTTILLFIPGSFAANVYVESCIVGPGNGSPANPYSTVSLAVANTSPDNTLVLQCGLYEESLVIDKRLTLISSGGSAIVGGESDRLWAGMNNADIFDEPDTAGDPAQTLGAMLDKLGEAELRILRIWIDYRLELDDNGNVLPVGEYNDCILEAIDNLMVQARARGILLLITLQNYGWLNSSYYMSIDHYSWRRCKTPALLYEQLAADPTWEGGSYDSPYQQRINNLGWGDYFSDAGAKDAYKQRVSHILNHRNPFIANRKWKDIDDVVWCWELMNEPDHFTDADILIPWLDEMGTYVKGIDPGTYVALGAKNDEAIAYELLNHNFVDVDIYTVHPWYIFLKEAIIEFMSPTGIGGQYGKLIFVEEFNQGWTGLHHPPTTDEEQRIEETMEWCEKVGIPWMFWEYGYKFDGDDIWHSGLDAHTWNDIIVPHAANAWNTLRPCSCKRWRVREMVNAIGGY